jgi:hypothetical protein
VGAEYRVSHIPLVLGSGVRIGAVRMAEASYPAEGCAGCHSVSRIIGDRGCTRRPPRPLKVGYTVTPVTSQVRAGVER